MHLLLKRKMHFDIHAAFFPIHSAFSAQNARFVHKLAKDSRNLQLEFTGASNAQVTFKNLMAIKNRLELLEAYALTQRQTLDEDSLQALRREWKRDDKQLPICVTSTVTYVPGVPEAVTEADRVASLRVPLQAIAQDETLGLKPENVHKLKLLLANRYDAHTDTISIECDRFPFVRQNVAFMCDTLQNAIVEAKNEDDLFADIPLKIFTKDNIPSKSDEISFQRVMQLTDGELAVGAECPMRKTSETVCVYPADGRFYAFVHD